MQPTSNKWSSRRFGRVAGALAVAAALLALGGCATVTTTTKPAPMTVSQIIKLSKDGVPPQDIIRVMRDSGTVYRLNASQLADLKQQGVSDQVINYMQQTYLEAVRRNQAYEDWVNYSWGPDGYWYGGVPYGWPPWW
jgi:hypothetical protein